jgi:hypothetical protein
VKSLKIFNFPHIKKEISDIICDLNVNNYIYIANIIANVKHVYPIGKNEIKRHIQKILKINLQKNQIKIHNKLIKCMPYANISKYNVFILTEGLFFLLKNKVKKISVLKLYNFFIYNYQLTLSYIEFKEQLKIMQITKSKIYINKKLLNNLIDTYNINTNVLYNKTYIIPKDIYEI